MALIIGLKPDKTSLSWLAGLPVWSLLDLQVGFRGVLAASGQPGLNWPGRETSLAILSQLRLANQLWLFLASFFPSRVIK